MKRFVLAGAAVLLLAFLLGRLLRDGSAGEVRLTGVVSANEAIVASELPGRIRELRVNEGDWVQKDQVVAVLATEEIDAQKESKLATIDQLTSRAEQGRERVRLERSRVASQIEGATAQLRAVESQRAEILAELDQARKELKRATELVAEGLVAEQIRERRESIVTVAEARLQTVEDRVEAARAEVELHRGSERQVRVMQQEVDQTEAQIDQARAELAQIAVRLGYMELKSPLTGMVSVRVAREGEFVGSGEPVVTIVDLTDVWVRAEVEESLVTRLVVGQPLDVLLASGERITGRVTFISPEAEFATQRDVDRVKRDIRTFGIKVAVPNPERRFHPGMTAYVLLPEEGTAPPERGAPGTPPPAQPQAPATGDAVAPDEPAPRKQPEQEEPRPAEASPASASASASALASNATRKPPPPRPEAAPRPPEPTPQRPAPRPAIAVATSDPAPPPPAAQSVEKPPPDPLPSPEASLEDLLSRMDSDDPTEVDLEALEAALLGEMAQEAAKSEEGPADAPAPVKGTTPPPGGCQPVDAGEPEPPDLELRLEVISLMEGRPVAVINGSRVFEGQTVEGARVVEITEGAVRLELDGRSITLTF